MVERSRLEEKISERKNKRTMKNTMNPNNIINASDWLVNSLPQPEHFLKISKCLVASQKKLGLTLDAVILYALIAERTELSLETSKEQSDKSFVDDYGVYCLMKIKTICEKLGWSENKAYSEVKRLQKSGLLVKETVLDEHNICTGIKLYLREYHPTMDKRPYPPYSRNYDFGFYCMPVALLELRSLSLNAKMLYVIALDSASLKERYERYDDGCLFCDLSASYLSELMNCSSRTFSRIVEELETLGLISRKQAGYCKPWHIFFRDYRRLCDDDLKDQIKTVPEEAARSTVEKQEHITEATEVGRQICTPVLPNVHSSHAKNKVPVSPNLRCSYNNKTDSFSHPLDSAAVRCLSLPPVCADVEDLVNTSVRDDMRLQALEVLRWCEAVLRKDLSNDHPFVCDGGGKSYSTDELKTAYAKLDAAILFVLIQKAIPKWPSIRNKERFIREGLYRGAEYHALEAKHFCIINSLCFDGATIGDYWRLYPS